MHSIEHCLVSRSLIDIVIVYLLAKLHLSGGLTLSTNILTHTLSLHNLFEVPSYVVDSFIENFVISLATFSSIFF